MKPKRFGQLAPILFIATTLAGCAQSPQASSVAGADVGQQSPTASGGLQPILAQVAGQTQTPALAVAVVKQGKVAESHIFGKRKVGEPDAATIHDKFGIGSLTKAMTAILIYKLVDAGKLNLTDRLGDLLPDVQMRPEYKNATLEQLLTFKAGIQPYTRIGPNVTPVVFELRDPMPANEQREKFIAHVLSEDPVAAPGEKEIYSNASYAILGQIASRTAGKDWEELVREWVFQPLQLKSAGFDDPSLSDPQNLVGHRPTPQGVQPVDASRAPRIESLAAAGSVHMSVLDLARFASEMLSMVRGESKLLTPASQNRLTERLADGATLLGGSMKYTAGIRYYPSQNMVVVAAANRGGTDEPILAVLDAASGEKPRPKTGFRLEPDPLGPKIAQVVPGSPADKAGLRAGDVILAINGQKTPSPSSPEFRRLLDSKSPAVLKVLRAGSEMQVELRLE